MWLCRWSLFDLWPDFSVCVQWKISGVRKTWKSPWALVKWGSETVGKIANRQKVKLGDRQKVRECVHSWPFPVGCRLRKASVGATCVGGVSQTERHRPARAMNAHLHGHTQTWHRGKRLLFFTPIDPTANAILKWDHQRYLIMPLKKFWHHDDND